MPIPLSQLTIWASQGAIATSSSTYASIRHALLKTSSPLANRAVEIYLQGSYANSTNIRGDSDVDVVVLYRDTFYSDISTLSPPNRHLHELTFPPAAYTWWQLQDDVITALRSHYGCAAVWPGRKAIKVYTGNGIRISDVVPAVQFRRYATFVDQNNLSAHWGIQFFDSANNPIVNYPKYHIARGEAKNHISRTSGKYKSTIRIFKNFRNYMIDNNLLPENVAPSYMLECALYNVPDAHFARAYTDAIPAILCYLLHTPYLGFLCQNGVTPLIGTGATQWSPDNFVTFVSAAQAAWDDWS